jgi:hypothetical protein
MVFFSKKQAIKTAARDLVLHGIVSQSNRPSIINGVRFYDCCSNINCRLRDRPFNLKGGVMVFCFVQSKRKKNIFSLSDEIDIDVFNARNI